MAGTTIQTRLTTETISFDMKDKPPVHTARLPGSLETPLQHCRIGAELEGLASAAA